MENAVGKKPARVRKPKDSPLPTYDNRSVGQKVRDKEYDIKLPYPDHKDPNYKELRKAYFAERSRLEDLLRRDLLVENDVVGHPKAQMVWDKAWEYGHYAGYHEVVNYFESLVELIK